MVLEVKKKERETSQSLIRRFSKSLQRSGILFRAKKNRFRIRVKSRIIRRAIALRREESKKEYEKLGKLGKLSKFGKRR